MKRVKGLLLVSALLAFVLLPALALAAPRSGGSFSGRGGFRSGGGSYSRGYSRSAPRGRAGNNFIIFPGFGWGFLPFGGGGGGLLGTLIIVGALGLGAMMLMRAVRRQQQGAGGWQSAYGSDYDRDDDDEAQVAPGRGFVTKVQLGLGRSARGIQPRLESFAAEGDTSSEAGLGHLLGQTALELLREKHSIRYGALDVSGPLNMTNTETKLNGLALAERARFQVERVRGAEGKVRRSSAEAVKHEEVMEYLLITVLVASRAPFTQIKKVTDREELDQLLADLGGVAQGSLLGLEVIWTPADPEDALTESDLLLNYPDLRAV
jgi:uncharacterized membrane protein